MTATLPDRYENWCAEKERTPSNRTNLHQVLNFRAVDLLTEAMGRLNRARLALGEFIDSAAWGYDSPPSSMTCNEAELFLAAAEAIGVSDEKCNKFMAYHADKDDSDEDDEHFTTDDDKGWGRRSDTPSMFQVVGAAVYDAATDTLTPIDSDQFPGDQHGN